MDKQLLRYVILPHGSEPACLLLPTVQGWTLPFVNLPGHIYTMAGEINASFGRAFGAAITILRAVYRHATPAGVPADRVYVAENHTRDWVPPAAARWVGHAELAGLELAVPEHRPVLEAWFADEAPASRVPWARRGWFSEACAWIDQVVSNRTGPVEQVKTWSLACLLRAPTADGAVYLKACPELLPAEMAVTALLAEAFPAHAPAVVATQPERRWLLTREFAGPLIEQVTDLCQWEEALRAYARMQIAFADRTGELLAAGCYDRTPIRIAADLTALLAETDLLVGPGRLSPDELAALRALAPELQALLAEAERLGPPATLEHGDLHPKNIALDGDRLLIFDWSDAALAHPFIGLVNFLETMGTSALPQTAEVRRRLRKAYLEPWAERWPAARLKRALVAAERLHKLHVATSVYRFLLPGAENPEEWLWAPAHFLRKLLPPDNA